MNVLAIDIGGTHIKFRSQRHRDVLKFKSGPKMTPDKMMEQVSSESAGWKYDRVSIGYPGPVVHDRPVTEPHNLGKGWVHFNYEKAFGGVPLRIINDAAMQALGSYKGGRMLFLGLGTGLGSAMVVNGIVQGMELAHLPWKRKKTYEDFLGLAALVHDGKKKWSKHVLQAIDDLQRALECDYVMLGGGNATLLKELPDHVVLGANENAFEGGFKLWLKEHHASR